MSSEERQRIIREQGSRPAEAEKQEGARSSREALTREEAARQGGQPSGDGPKPSAESDSDRPVPRR
jgi:hypothetical protein